MRKEIWAYMPDPTSDRVTDYRRGRGLADDIGTPYFGTPVAGMFEVLFLSTPLACIAVDISVPMQQ